MKLCQTETLQSNLETSEENPFFENIQKICLGIPQLTVFKLSKLRSEYESPVMVQCKFGQVPKGCVLLYQQPVVQGPDITPITSHTTNPKLLLPQLKNNYCTVLKEQELESFLSIHLPAGQSKEYESVTRKQ